jgi:hypothetical protein
MASSYSPSAAIVRTARNEVVRVQRALDTLAQRRAALMAQIAELDSQARSHERRLALLSELAAVEDATPAAEIGTGELTVAPARALRGRELRREAGRLLWQWRGAEPVHYREWFERVLAAGYATGGKDPAASFLSNVRESPAVLRAEGQGRYQLDPASLDRVETEISEAQAELVDVEASIDRAYEQSGPTGDLRRHRDDLKQQLRRLQAKHDEVAYVFAEDHVAPPEGLKAGAALRAA